MFPIRIPPLRERVEDIVALAKRHNLVIMADEIYDQMVYDDAEFIPMATLVDDGVCLGFSGLSKVYRACGYRVGWCVFSGDLDRASDYVHSMELLAALRLCSNVPGQWAVQTALGGFQSIGDLVQPGGRLYQSRQAIIDRVEGRGAHAQGERNGEPDGHEQEPAGLSPRQGFATHVGTPPTDTLWTTSGMYPQVSGR